MLFRIEVGPLTPVPTGPDRALQKKIFQSLGIDVAFCRIIQVFTVDGINSAKATKLVELGIWHDPLLQRASLGPLPCLEPKPDWFCEVGFRPGVTDNVAKTAAQTAAIALDMSQEEIRVYSSLQYRFGSSSSHKLLYSDIENIANNLLSNSLIQKWRILDFSNWLKSGGFPAVANAVSAGSRNDIAYYELLKFSDEKLERESKIHTWALTLDELKTIGTHFSAISEERKKYNLPPCPTDVEMEVLAQTWSEHCKHKIFASKISFFDKNSKRHERLDNLYKSCIRDTTALIRSNAGEKDFCLSVFKDNAGVIQFVNGYDACIKVETHNSPSALDPYGGALTGIVGVNRDPMGTGLGASLVCNMDVFCFAPPDYSSKLPPRILHPARILEGVRKGVEDGGNKSGIPTINGSIIFENRYLGKPLVFCGTVGILPSIICGHPGYEKAAQPGDIIVMAGGRIGKDGIHGATFSSEELHSGSPATAVQIGDPITQKKMYDFMLIAREKCLYHSITDNGAGGLSSSVGEMAQDTGGCLLDLSRAPLKYDGLAPWEILLSEAQERMTFAVPKEKLEAFISLAKNMDVEATALGEFTETGYFEIKYAGSIVGRLNMDFLFNGDPQLNLEAEWEQPDVKNVTLAFPAGEIEWQNNFLERMLSRYNICSRENIIRQYDHEVRGGSVIKPVTGIMRDGPSDAAVIRPLLESDAGLVLAHGICPKYSDADTYWMVANAIDEAIRNAVCVGANPDLLAGVDNFCWCDPVYSSANPDGKYKLGQLVRACRSLRQFCLAYGVPCISGKDSMKNDYLDGNERISIPPTLLFTILGVIPNVTRTQTSDFKNSGDRIFILGKTWSEMGYSEANEELEITGGEIPKVDAQSAKTRYQSLSALIEQRVISACHDCSDGGFAVALAEMAIGGRKGCKIDLSKMAQVQDLSVFELLYSESASRHIVTCKPEFAPLLDALGMWQICREIGEVTQDGIMTICAAEKIVLQKSVDELVTAFKKTPIW